MQYSVTCAELEFNSVWKNEGGGANSAQLGINRSSMHA